MRDRRPAGRNRPTGSDGPPCSPDRPGDRAAAPVVGKVLEVGLVVLFVGAVTATLYGGVVPDFRAAAGDEVTDRTVAAAAQRVQAAVPPNGTAVGARAEVTLPETIESRSYRIVVRGRTLVLEHPNPDVAASARLALPESVVNVSGSWDSQRRAWIVVERTSGGLAVRLEGGDG